MKYRLFMFHLWMVAFLISLLGTISNWDELDKMKALSSGLLLSTSAIFALLYLGFFLKEYIETAKKNKEKEPSIWDSHINHGEQKET